MLAHLTIDTVDAHNPQPRRYNFDSIGIAKIVVLAEASHRNQPVPKQVRNYIHLQLALLNIVSHKNGKSTRFTDLETNEKPANTCSEIQ